MRLSGHFARLAVSENRASCRPTSRSHRHWRKRYFYRTLISAKRFAFDDSFGDRSRTEGDRGSEIKPAVLTRSIDEGALVAQSDASSRQRSARGGAACLCFAATCCGREARSGGHMARSWLTLSFRSSTPSVNATLSANCESVARAAALWTQADKTVSITSATLAFWRHANDGQHVDPTAFPYRDTLYERPASQITGNCAHVLVMVVPGSGLASVYAARIAA
jgi:hypothetical protein